MEQRPLFQMRPLMMAALGMCAGILTARFVAMPGLLWLAGGALALAAAAAILRRRGLMILLAFFALSLALMPLRATEAPAAGPHAISGRVCETPARNKSGWTVTLDGVTADGTPRRQRLMLYLRTEKAPAYGDRISATASLAAPYKEYASSYAYWRVSCVGFAGDYSVTERAAAPDLYGRLLLLRARLSERIYLLFPDSGGIAAGMLLGVKSGIPDETMTAYRQSGAAHLLAVSGLHVSILAGAWSLLFRRRSWLRFVMTALFLLAYAVLTAFPPSVLRAGVMFLCWALAVPLKQPPDRMSALSLAFIIVLFVNPYALFYVGFQLSFLAAYGLTLLAPMLEDRLSGLGTQLSSGVAAGVSVWVATLPAQILFFGSAPLLSLLTNLFLLPVVPFFLIPAFLLTALSFVSLPVADALAFLPRWALYAVDALARLDPGLQLALPAPPGAALLLYMAGLLFFSRLCMRSRARRTLYAGACFIGAALLWALQA